MKESTLPQPPPPLQTLHDPRSDDRPASPALPELPELPALDELRFRVGGERARGGLGKVLEADDRFLGRRLAVKQLLDTTNVDATARFVREALITARLQHPSIVPVYDAGLRGSGEPFYSMKLVYGRSLRDEIDFARNLDERLALLPHIQSVADAVAYAHEEGVIHRDLKPSNVLVGPFGETVVVDWGLAKYVDDDAEGRRDLPDDPYELAGDDDVTRVGAVLGTPAYMPPEQARGDEVDARADVYAIGAMLYDLLAGEPPYVGDTSTQTLQSVQAGPPDRIGDRERSAPRDLCAIVDKAMARDPADRYPDARQLAADLKRFLTGQLVGARRYSPWALVWRWIARHRGAVAITLILLVALGITATVSARRVVRERDRATASNNRLLLQTAAAELSRDPTAALAWLSAHRPDETTIDRARNVAAQAIGTGVARYVFDVPGSTATAVCMTGDGSSLVAINRDGDVWMWDLQTRRRRHLGSIGERPIRCGFSPDDRYLVAIPRGGTVYTAEVPGEMKPLGDDVPKTRTVHFMPDGATLLYGDPDGGVRTRDLHTGAERTIAVLGEPLHWMTATRDGARVAAASYKGGVFVVDVATGEFREIARRAYPANGAAWTDDGRRLVHGGHDGVWLHDIETGQTWQPPADAELGGVVIASPTDDGIVITSSMKRSMWMWRPESNEMEQIAWNTTHVSPARSRDRRRVVWTANDGGVHVRDSGSRRGAPLRGHSGHVRALAIADDGHRFATASEDGVVRVWEPPASLPRAIKIDDRFVYTAVVPKHRAVVTGTFGGVLTQWTAGDGTATPTEIPSLDGGGTSSIATSPDENVVAFGDRSQCRVRLWYPATQTIRDLTCDGDGLSAVQFATNDGLLTGHGGGEVRHWNIATGETRVVAVHRADPEGVRVSPDGKYGMSQGLDGLHFFNLETGVDVAKDLEYGLLFGMLFSPDGKQLASGGSDGVIRLWDPATGDMTELGRHRSAVMRMRWNPRTGDLLVGDESGHVARWSVRDGTHETLLELDAAVRAFGISASGRFLAVGDTSGLIRVLDLTTGATTLLRGHEASTVAARFATDDVLLTNDLDGWMYIWHLEDDRFVARDPAALAATTRAATTAEVGPDGEVRTPVLE